MSNVEKLEIDLARDNFLRELLRQLSGTLQDVIGIDEAEGYISIVGARVGNNINDTYRTALNVDKLSAEQVADVLVDLKRRIQGKFYIIEQSVEKIVFGNHACPFAEKVDNRPSLCMMTSNVFGTITAENLGYARVELHETIARGDDQCKVTVYLQPTESPEGREYFAA